MVDRGAAGLTDPPSSTHGRQALHGRAGNAETTSGGAERPYPGEVVTEVLHGTQDTSYRFYGGYYTSECGPPLTDHRFQVVI